MGDFILSTSKGAKAHPNLKPFKPGQSGNPSGRPPSPLTPALKRISHEQIRELAEMVMTLPLEEVEKLARNKKLTAIQVLVANALVGAHKRREFGTVNQILDRIIGKPTMSVLLEGFPVAVATESKTLTFVEFCAKAGYPAPFPKQLEMRDFGMTAGPARLLLGARGYGKTDYVTVLGIAYEVYLDPKFTVLILTKSDERNAAMLEEIRKAAEANGVTFEKANSSCLRVKGLLGKDHSVSAATIGTSSLRGRHPKMVIMDDPVTEDDVSEATRKRVQRKYNEVSKLTGNVLVIGQPVHKTDLYQTLRPLLHKMEVPHGSIPELDADLTAMQLAGISAESISASYHLKVISETGFPLETVRLIDTYSPADSFAFIDPSFEGGDFTALTILKGHFDGVAVKGKLFKRAWNHCLPEMIAEMKAMGVRRVGFETNSLGDMPLEILRNALSDCGIGVVGKKSTGHKHSRILAAGAYSHLIHLSKDSDRAYIEQIVNYEYGAKNDDAPDSLASCLELVGLIRGKQGAQ